VDWLGVDGYNWGTEPPHYGAGWLWPTQLFTRSLTSLHALDPSRPIMICETASATAGGDKAVWITSLLRDLPPEFSSLRAIMWFNEDKEHDWRVNSSPAALEAYRAALPPRE
jgi:hypothetical protein